MPSWLYFTRASNMAFHNLTKTVNLPPGFRSLLGLGLGFCPIPRMSTPVTAIDTTRFLTNTKLKMFFDDNDDKPVPKLYFKSNWKPPDSEFHPEFIERLTKFVRAIHLTTARQRRSKSNLLPWQRIAFAFLRNNKHLHVFKTDKNLGPAIIETETYVRRALDEHLLDSATYGKLHEVAAESWMDELREEIKTKIIAKLPKGNDKTYLQRSLAAVQDPFAYFYLLAKVHKTPWKTRPIISVSGSMLYALGKWVDVCLQNIITTLPYVCRSSYHLAQELRELRLQSTNATLFTMDAVSMYTNIDTDHALAKIGEFMRSQNIVNLLNAKGIKANVLLEALTIIMRNNVFKFGDTFWYQKTGTAMGTPPAPPYATLYFALHEIEVIGKFPKLLFYRRLIDDGFGVWNGEADSTFTDFQTAINNYGQLTWEFSQMRKEVNYLDLTISVKPSIATNSCTLSFKLYEKALNLYLYLPPNSAHPPGILKGLIYGMVLRIRRLTSDDVLVAKHIMDLFRRLRQRGYSLATLKPLFLAAMLRADGENKQELKKKLLFLHLPFHPTDPPASTWRSLFVENVGHPPGSLPLCQLQGRLGYRRTFGEYRFIVAYSRQPTLGNLLSPRRLRSNVSINDFVDGKGLGITALAACATTAATVPLNQPLTYTHQQNQLITTNNAASVLFPNTYGNQENNLDATAAEQTRTAATTTNLIFSQDQGGIRAPNFASIPSEQFRWYPESLDQNLGPHHQVDIRTANVSTSSNQSDRHPPTQTK